VARPFPPPFLRIARPLLPRPEPGLALNDVLEIEIAEREPGLLRARIQVGNAASQPIGYLHGGAYWTVAGTLASMGTLDGASTQEHTPLDVGGSIDVLEPAAEGTIEAIARMRHRGYDVWLWMVELTTTPSGAICALCHVRVAVRQREETESH
jgi:uncharacterized protein (TIGR00369 family)